MTCIRYLMVCDDICICNKSYVFIPKHSHYIKYDFIMQLSTTGCIRKMVEHNYPNFCGCLIYIYNIIKECIFIANSSLFTKILLAPILFCKYIIYRYIKFKGITQYSFALISTTLILVLFVCRTCAAQSDQPWGWGILLPETYRSPRYHLSISFWLWVIKRQYHRKTIREINHWPRSGTTCHLSWLGVF